MALLLRNQDPTTASTQASHVTVGAATDGRLFAKDAAGNVTYFDLIANIALTGLTGGGAGDLDTIATAAGATELLTIRRVQVGTPGVDYQLSTWVLKSGTYATNTSAGFVRPLDYATTTNEKVWCQAG